MEKLTANPCDYPAGATPGTVVRVLTGALFTVVSSIAAPAIAANHALLIAVSDYADERITDLEGPQFDVSALRKVLIEDWQYPPANITTLLNEEATEVGILEALDRLAAETSSGDTLTIYFSGHGTSAQDHSLGAQLHLPDGSGAIVAHDFDPERFVSGSPIDASAKDDGLLIGRYDMRPRFEAMDKDRTLLVMFDACFAGNTARRVDSELTPRNKRFVSLGLATSTSRGAGESSPSQPALCEDCADALLSNYPYNNVVYFGAAAEHELAVDISQAEIDAGLASSFDGKPHGAFTDALLRALVGTAASANGISYRALFQNTLRQFQTHCESCGHTPVMLPSSVLTDLAVVNSPVFPGLVKESAIALNDNEEWADDAIADIVVASADTLSLAPWLAPVVTRQIGNLNDNASALLFTHNGSTLEARSTDGRLITELTGDKNDTLDWVSSRSALQNRIRQDKTLTTELPVELAHPLHGAEFYFGEKVTFSTRVDARSRLLVMALDTAGDLHRLYPVSKQEWSAVIPAGRAITLPAVGSPDLVVAAPAGTDELLFYAVPAEHPHWVNQSWADFDQTAVDFSWLDSVLLQSPSRVSAAHRRLVAVAPE